MQFQACSFYCRVWINGKEIGDHRAGGYGAFVLDAPPPPQNTTYNEIFVLVDNRFKETTASLQGGGFWPYGGITRSVELYSMPDKSIMWPCRLYVLPESLSTVHLTLHLSSKFYSGPIDNIPSASLSMALWTVALHCPESTCMVDSRPSTLYRTMELF
jgi:beta-glucuronidase